MAKFDKSACKQEIENLTIEEIQDRIVDIDERTYDDLHRREVLSERRTELFNQEPKEDNRVVKRRWSFGLVEKRFPFFPGILKKNKDVGSYIVKKHPEMLEISRKDLERVLVELGYDQKDIDAFVDEVSTKIRPYVTAKRL